MDSILAWYALGAAASLVALPKLKTRLELSRAKHPSLTGHARMSRQVAKLLPHYEYDGEKFFRADGAPEGREGLSIYKWVTPAGWG